MNKTSKTYWNKMKQIWAISSVLFFSLSLLSQETIMNIGPGAGEGATYVNSYNLFNIGPDCAWYAEFSNSHNIFTSGVATGEQSLYMSSFDISLNGPETGMAATYYLSGFMHLNGHFSGYDSTFYKCREINSLGGLQSAYLVNSYRVTSIGSGAGDNINGNYTNVVFIGAGSTAPAGTRNTIVAQSMKVRFGSTNEWEFLEPTMRGTNLTLKVRVNGVEFYLLSAP